MLKCHDHVGIVVNSNGQSIKEQEKIETLIRVLEGFGLIVQCSPYLYQKDNVFSAHDQQKADIMMKFYKDDRIKAIFDISGGDLANSIIDLLDYQIIKEHPKPFFGYSDLTCLMNAIYTSTKQYGFLYQVKNLVGSDSYHQQQAFYETFFKSQSSLFDFQYHFIQGHQLSGIVVGGNIRCFLKLAGTPYFPHMQDKILFLESLGGESALMYSHLIHFKQLGVFQHIRGIILGTFTMMEKHNCQPSIEDMLISIVGKDMPIVKTREIGHAQNSKALIIGQYIEINKYS